MRRTIRTISTALAASAAAALGLAAPAQASTPTMTAIYFYTGHGSTTLVAGKNPLQPCYTTNKYQAAPHKLYLPEGTLTVIGDWAYCVSGANANDASLGKVASGVTVATVVNDFPAAWIALPSKGAGAYAPRCLVVGNYPAPGNVFYLLFKTSDHDWVKGTCPQ
jgi:hypothetical protein